MNNKCNDAVIAYAQKYKLQYKILSALAFEIGRNLTASDLGGKFRGF